MAQGKVGTYNCKKVLAAFGPHALDGWAEDSFITIEPNGEGTTKQVGCDGEIARSLDPDRTYNVKFSLLQQSNSSKYLQKMSEFDRETGKGVFPLIITDLSGATIFYSDSAWIAQYAARVYGKAQQNREWQMQCAEGTYAE